MSFTFYLLSPVYPLFCLVMCMLRGKVCRSDGGADWLWTAPMIYHCPCPPVHNASGVLKMISHGQQHHHNFHFAFFLRSKSRSWPGLHPWGYFQIRAVFLAARETNFFSTLTILFNTNICVWVTILKGFFIHWKIKFYDWHLVTLRIVLVSRMTWRVGKLTKHLPETRGIWVEIGRNEKAVWSRMTGFKVK